MYTEKDQDTTRNKGKSLVEMVEELGLDKNLFFMIHQEGVKTDTPSPDNPLLKRQARPPEDPGYLSDDHEGTYSFCYDHKMLVTKDKESAEKLRKAYAFNSVDWNGRGIGVPFTSGERVAEDSIHYNAFLSMEENCATKKQNDNAKKRTMAVQRGSLITTYEPNRINGLDEYVNVAYYKQLGNGNYCPVDSVSAASILKKEGYLENKLDPLHVTSRLTSNEVQGNNTKQQVDSQKFMMYATRKGNNLGG